MKQQCCYAKTGQKNTAGEDQEVLICYCGTTACQNLPVKLYPLPSDMKQVVGIEVEGLTREEERRFYEKLWESPTEKQFHKTIN